MAAKQKQFSPHRHRGTETACRVLGGVNELGISTLCDTLRLEHSSFVFYVAPRQFRGFIRRGSLFLFFLVISIDMCSSIWTLSCLLIRPLLSASTI